MPSCTVCGEKQKTIDILKLHLQLKHSKCHQTFKCREPDCSRTLNDWASFRRHFKSAHENLSFTSEKEIPYISVTNNSMEYETEEVYDPTDSCPVENDMLEPLDLLDLEKYVQSLAMTLICKLYADPRLPRCHVQQFVEDVGNLLENVLCKVKQFFKPFCANGVAPLDDLCSAVTKPFKETFSTEYRRFNILENFPNFVKARDYVIGDKLVDVYRENRVIKDRKAVTAKFVPMRETLKHFFSLPGVFSKTFSHVQYLSAQQGRGIVSNFVQAELWQEKIVKFPNKLVFPLFLYYDDFEVNNPLGSHCAANKIGGVYYSIPCLPSEFRSKVENIFVAALFRASDRHTCFEGNDAVFGIIVEELNFLSSEGVQINVSGTAVRIYFLLGLFLGDNEALNSSLGFMGGPNANFYCRICKMSKHKCLRNCAVQENDMRTQEQYEMDGFQAASDTGVKENSIWNLVDGFHVTKNPYCDPAHDLLEGVCRYDMGQILFKLIFTDQVLSVDSLNAKIRSFDYKSNGFSNKPPPLKHDKIRDTKQVKMTASEMFTFILIFPFLVENILENKAGQIKININSEIWQFFSVLRQILDIAFAKTIRSEQYGLVDSLVNQHNFMYIKLFKDTLKPKFHNLRHMKYVLLKSGPISNLSVLRFESKHQHLKAISKSTTSRQNISHTITKKDQFRFFCRVEGKVGLQDTFAFGDGDVFDCISLCEDYVSFQSSFPVNFPGPYSICPWINRLDVGYRVGSYIVVDVNADGMLEFGKIKTIIVNVNSEVCFVFEKLSVESFNEAMHAYEVAFTSEVLCCLATDLISPFLAIHHLSGGRHMITLRHSV